jgi:hypothetical protein
MFTVVTMMYTQHAQGDRHIWDVTSDTRQYAVLCMWLGQFSFLVCGGCTKVSILFFYRRLVEGTYSKRWTWLVWLAISFTIAYTIAFCVMLLINCSPTESYWRAFDIQYAMTQSYTCLDTSAINAITGVCAVVSDVYAVALPCIITWHYAIPKRQKIALNVIFSLGLIVVVASCIRTYWLMSTWSPISHLGRWMTDFLPQKLETRETSPDQLSTSSSGPNSNCKWASCVPPPHLYESSSAAISAAVSPRATTRQAHTDPR